MSTQNICFWGEIRIILILFCSKKKVPYLERNYLKCNCDCVALFQPFPKLLEWTRVIS